MARKRVARPEPQTGPDSGVRGPVDEGLVEGFDSMGQDPSTRGEPTPEALEELRKAQEQAGIPPSVQIDGVPEVSPPPEPVPQAEPAPANPLPSDLAGLVGVIKDNPAIAAEIVKAASQTQEGRTLLNIPAGVGTPQGKYHRNFDREEHLFVTGGLEVSHPLDPGDGAHGKAPSSLLHPPGILPPDGTTTDYKDESERPPDSQIPCG